MYRNDLRKHDLNACPKIETPERRYHNLLLISALSSEIDKKWEFFFLEDASTDNSLVIQFSLIEFISGAFIGFLIFVSHWKTYTLGSNLENCFSNFINCFSSICSPFVVRRWAWGVKSWHKSCKRLIFEPLTCQ